MKVMGIPNNDKRITGTSTAAVPVLVEFRSFRLLIHQIGKDLNLNFAV
jgi:hypothetical protein